MKKLFLWGILVGLSGWFPAQAQKGTTYWGGTVSIQGKKSDNGFTGGDLFQNYGSHTISPEIQWGKFVNSSTVVGLGLGYHLNWYKNTDESTSGVVRHQYRNINQWVELLPFVRKYKFLNERWAVFLHGEVGPTHGWNNVKSVTDQEFISKSNYWIYSLNIKPGVVYSFPGKRVSIEGYADVISLNAKYSPFKENSGREFKLSSGVSTRFPSYFTIRLAKCIPSNEK